MIRTRDFLLYMLVLVFLVTVTVFTAQSKSGKDLSAVDTVTLPESVVVDLEISSVAETDDKAARLADLQAKIAAGEGLLLSAPPVFTSVDSTDSIAFDEVVVATGTGSLVSDVQYCGAPLPNLLVADWPAQPGVTRSLDGEVSVVFEKEVVQTVGSSTRRVVVAETYTTVPVRTIRSNFDSCLPDTTIGVTSNGLPLANTDAWQYQSVPETSQIGFARDGFGVYGPVAGDVELDDCGGLYVNGVYQYHVSGPEHIISCFAGIPVTL